MTQNDVSTEPAADKAVQGKSRASWHWAWLLVALIIAFVVIIRIRLLDFPLERDEGELAYAGQLMLQGVPPYKLAYHMKLPGAYGAYALFLALLGQTQAAVHWGLLLINASTIIVIYLLGSRLFGRLAGVVACASYGLLSLSPSVLGFSAHTEHFVVLPALGGILLLLKAIETGRVWWYFGSGVLVGLAFLMKQHGMVFVVFGALYFIWSEWRKSEIDWRGAVAGGGAYSLGAVLPFALTCLVLYASGVFDKFWFWTFSYARQYATSLSIQDGFQIFLQNTTAVIGSSALIWALAGVGLISFSWDRERRDHAAFAIAFLILSFIGVCPGFYFRSHYFILMLPAVSLLAGLGVSSARRYLMQRGNWAPWAAGPVLLFLVAFGYAVLQQKEFFFKMDPRMASRVIYGGNPFPESLEIGKYIREHSDPGARIAVIGSEPQIYFYSGRRSVTGYVITYGLMEKQKYALLMQKEMIAEIEGGRPEYVVFVNVATSWLPGPGSEKLIFAWADQYIGSQYDREGLIDILSKSQTEYRWGEDAKGYQPRSQYYLQVFRRKTSSDR